MDGSDSDRFESAGEDFDDDDDDQDGHRHHRRRLDDVATQRLQNQAGLKCADDDAQSDVVATATAARATAAKPETKVRGSRHHVAEKKDRPPQRCKEHRGKFTLKLGSKINIDKAEIEKVFRAEEAPSGVSPCENKTEWEPFEDETSDDKVSQAEPKSTGMPPGVTACWEDTTGWDPFEDKPADKKSDLYSKNTKNEGDWGDFEADYMEIPQQKGEDFQPVIEKISDSNQSAGGWGSWGGWGVSSLLSTASLGVTTLTSSVSQGISTVLESGIGVPDPEELARMHIEEKTQEQSRQPQPETQTEKPDSQRSFGLGDLVSGVSHITKLVETTSTKVLSGGLDTLEVIGKKTMEVLQEGDPGLKKKRSLFVIEQDKPVLSQVLREAKEKAEEENKRSEETHFARKAHFETLFDDYQGLVHLEALEMLSKQCDIKLETLIESYSGNALTDMQETMAQIKELCELPDDDEDESDKVESIREKLNSAVEELNIKLSYDQLFVVLEDIESWLIEANESERSTHQKAIETLAELTAVAVEQFHKAGELMLVKDRRSTVDEADSLVQLTITLTSLIGNVAKKFSEKLNSFTDDKVNNLITNIFLEAANSSSYIKDAFQLLIPVLQVGAV